MKNISFRPGDLVRHTDGRTGTVKATTGLSALVAWNPHGVTGVVPTTELLPVEGA